MILPGWMWGPGDAAPTSSGQLLLDFLKQKLPGVIDGGTSIVDARDVASAMVTAAGKGRSGERYIVSGPFLDFQQILTVLEKVTGVPAPTRQIPYALSVAVGFGSEIWSRLTGKNALVTVEAVRTIHAKKPVDSAKAIRELGATFRPFEQTVKDEVDWYRANGYL